MTDHSESVQAKRDEIEHEQTIRSEKFLCELKAHLDAAMLKHEQLLQDAVAAARTPLGCRLDPLAGLAAPLRR